MSEKYYLVNLSIVLILTKRSTSCVCQNPLQLSKVQIRGKIKIRLSLGAFIAPLSISPVDFGKQKISF